MNQAQILDNIKSINYVVNTKTGGKFRTFINICKYFYDLHLGDVTNEELKMILVSQYKIIYDIFIKLMPDKSDMGRIFDPDTMKIVTPEYIKIKSDEICQRLLSYYKFIILTELIQSNSVNLIQHVVDYYLAGTHIGGSSKRGWSEEERQDIISFAKANPKIIEMYAEDSIRLDYNGFLYVNDIAKFDEFGRNIHASYSMYKVETGMKKAELEHQQLQFDKSVTKGVEDFLSEGLEESYNIPHISIESGECIRPCDRRLWPGKWSTEECACPVKKKGWLGEYIEIEKCPDSMCDRQV